MNDVGSRIREIRIVKGITSVQLSQFLGVSQSFISRIESGSKKCSLETLGKICKIFNISLAEFFTDKNNTQPLPPDIAKFSIDKENHNLIRLIHNMKDAGYNNEAIESWLKSMYSSLDDLIQKHGGIQGKPQGKVVFAYDATPEEEEIRKKISDPNFKLPFKE